MEKTVNAITTLTNENIIQTLGAALDTLNDLADTGIIDEEIIFDAFPVISAALRDVLDNKFLAYVVEDCRTGEYSVHIFDTLDDCRYFLDGVLTECYEITVDELKELAPYDWNNLSKYSKTDDGTMVFRDIPD